MMAEQYKSVAAMNMARLSGIELEASITTLYCELDIVTQQRDRATDALEDYLGPWVGGIAKKALTDIAAMEPNQ